MITFSLSLRWANLGLSLLFFLSFHNSITNIILFLLEKLKKRGCCSWDSNPRPQHGGRRHIHCSMTAALLSIILINCFIADKMLH